jgi:glycosyltransferase involved in cell wall biosynthesis
MNGDIGADEKISICIPTFERPRFLAEALNSCIEQDWRNYEILVGDDSRGKINEDVIAAFRRKSPGEIRHLHNAPSLGQAGNVNNLFQNARCSRLLLLHDDDLLTEGALRRLAACWQTNPATDLAFGKQQVISHDGAALAKQTEDLNRRYRRVPENAGHQNVPAAVGVTRMMPSNGYLVRTTLARIGYKTEAEVGPVCDMEFAAQLCVQSKNIVFIDEFTSQYRLSEEGITRSGKYPLEAITYAILKKLDLPPEATPFRSQAMRAISKFVVSDLARIGYRREALSLMASKDYALADWLAPRCVFSVALMLNPLLARKSGYPSVLEALGVAKPLSPT